MSELDSDFAPDLEWMLQSGQVPRDLMLEALILEFYTPVYHLSLALLDDHHAARRAAFETFSRALIEIHQYRPEDGAVIWLFRITLGICRSIEASLKTRRSIKASLPFLHSSTEFGDSIPQNALDANTWLEFDLFEFSTRASAVLHFLLQWDLKRIAALLNEPEQDVQLHIDAATQAAQISPYLSQSNAGDQLTLQRLQFSGKPEESLKQSLQRRWSQPEFSTSNLDRTIAQISRRSSMIGSRRQGIISILEIALIAVIIFVGIGVAWGFGRFESNLQPSPTATPAVRTVLVTQMVVNYVTATPVPFQPVPEASSTPNRIPLDSYAFSRTGERLEALAERLGTTAELLQEFNRIPPGERLKSGQRFLLPAFWSHYFQLSLHPTPFSPITPAAALEEPVLSESILQRIAVQGPLYSTLWFDARIIDNGPRSYIGPPLVLRYQSWDAPSQSLALIGSPNHLPKEVFLRLGSTGYIAQPATDAPWFSEWRLFEQNSSAYREILSQTASLIFDTRELERGYTFKVVGRESQAGIQALVFDVFDREDRRTDRIWYDERRGMILRRIVYPSTERGQHSLEVSIQQIAYDVVMPPRFFNPRLPWSGGFAADSVGAPAPIEGERERYSNERPTLSKQPTPAGFDPRHSSLTFQFSPSFSIGSPTGRAGLFADDYYLGDVLFGNPWETICDRSPDGEWLAYVSKPVHQDDSNSFLRWFSLKDPVAEIFTLSTHFGVSEFAFSPDSRHIVFFSRPARRGMGSLGILDVNSQREETLMPVGDVNSLVWNPDGSSFAMIARYDPSSYEDYVAVYDLNKGKITYSASIDTQSNAFQDWPMLDWEADFPVEMGTMDSCAMSTQIN